MDYASSPALARLSVTWELGIPGGIRAAAPSAPPRTLIKVFHAGRSSCQSPESGWSVSPFFSQGPGQFPWWGLRVPSFFSTCLFHWLIIHSSRLPTGDPRTVISAWPLGVGLTVNLQWRFVIFKCSKSNCWAANRLVSQISQISTESQCLLEGNRDSGCFSGSLVWREDG